MSIKEKAKKYFDETVALRRGFHMYPDMYPALNEGITRTTKIVMEELEKYGVPYEILPDYSILATIDSGKPGKTILLRADMDALPIQEECNEEYCSKIDGVAHLCGHDCHTASLITATRILNEEKDKLQGKVKCIFQSCEEDGNGAIDIVLYEGVMDDVNAVFGVHTYTELEAGTVSVQAGPRMAASMRCFIEFQGKAGHGSSPHLCIDPVVAASSFIMNLQSIVSREMNTFDSVAITVGTIHGGSICTAVADKVNLGLTIKFLNPDIGDHIKESITRIAMTTAETFRAKCELYFDMFFRPVVNDSELAAIAEKSAETLIGKENIIECTPWTASEDYSEYTKYVPGIFAFIGVRNESKGIINAAHHPKFMVDEKSLEIASGLYAQFAFDYLTKE